jgi:hypothetical protein
MRTVVEDFAEEDGAMQLLGKDKMPKALDKAYMEADRVSKETFWASEEARRGGRGSKREIEGKGEEEDEERFWRFLKEREERNLSDIFC